MRFLPLWAVTAATLGLSSSCRLTTEQASSATPRIEPVNAEARRLSLAGLEALLEKGAPEGAREAFASALNQDSHEPWALLGNYLLARRAERRAEALTWALELCEKAPSHPLSSVAARGVLELSGVSGLGDDAILKRVPAVLERSQSPDTNHLLRTALASILFQRQAFTEAAQLLSDMGAPGEWTVLGPISAFTHLSFETLSEPEKTGFLPDSLERPWGPIQARTLRFSEGRLHFSHERNLADGYLAAVDVTVTEAGPYLLRTVGQVSHKAYVDGTLLVHRKTFEASSSSVNVQGVFLEPGKHRLLLRISKSQGNARLGVSLGRADARPAGLAFSPARGAAPSWKGVALEKSTTSYPHAGELYQALLSDVPGPVAVFVAVKDALGRDSDGAKRLLASLPQAPAGPAWATLRAELALADKAVPIKVSQGRMARELAMALEADPAHFRALSLSVSLAIEQGRYADATEALKRARSAPAGFSDSLLMLQARLEGAQQFEALAEKSAQQALLEQPGLCEALNLLLDVARRRDATQKADEWLTAMSACPGAALRRAEHARFRGKTDEAMALYQSLWTHDETSISLGLSLVELHVSKRQYDEAQRVLDTLAAFWPQQASLWLKKAEVFDLAKAREKAVAARQKALSLDGSDLTTQRMVARATTGKELLADFAISTQDAIKAYEASGLDEEATSVYVLDAATVEVFPDGSMVDRIHTIQKALDQSGVSKVAEVDVPAGAQVLHLRTVKADGTVLEPETIAEKDSISLPGVEVGDFVDVEYLLAHPPRGPAQPGFTAASFYFQLLNQANAWSTYQVVAPQGMKLSVDAHNLTAPKPEILPDGRHVFRFELKNLAPFLPEPQSPPMANEYLPFVTVGAGTFGQEPLLTAWADTVVSLSSMNFELEQFAKGIGAGKSGKALVQALYEAIVGRQEAPWKTTPGQDRQNRLWLLKAALEAQGLEARVAAVRTFNVDPATYLFPDRNLAAYLCLHVTLPSGEAVWLDTSTRWAPFGTLPEAASEKDAFLLPEPGRPLKRLQTPRQKPVEGKQVTLDMTLGTDGTLEGQGKEVFSGFEGSQIAEALEQMAVEQRGQALQAALSRYFRGAELSAVSVKMPQKPGESLEVGYQFKVPRFAREDNGRWTLSALTFPSQLGKRYVQLGRRKTPLYIDSTEKSQTKVSLKLPPGFRVLDTLSPLKVVSPFGACMREEKFEGGKLRIEENFRLDMARISPSQYQAFTQFAGEVDLLQSRDLVVGVK